MKVIPGITLGVIIAVGVLGGCKTAEVARQPGQEPAATSQQASVPPETSPDDHLVGFHQSGSNILYREGLHPIYWGARRLLFWPGGRVLFNRDVSLDCVRVWDVVKKQEIGQLRGFRVGSSASTSALAVSPDGTLLATAGDNEIVIYRAPLGPQTYTIPESAASLAFYGPTGEWLASASGNNVTLWRIEDGRGVRHTHTPVEPGLGRSESVYTSSLGVSPPLQPDALLYAVVSKRSGITPKRPIGSSQHMSLRTWRLPSLKEGPFVVENVRQAVLSPDGRYLAVIRSHASDPREDVGRIQILDPRTGQVWSTFMPNPSLQPAVTLSFSRDSRLLTVGHQSAEKQSISLWDVGRRQLISVLSPASSGTRWSGPPQVSFSHDNKWMAIGGSSTPLDVLEVTWQTAKEKRVADTIKEARELMAMRFEGEGIQKLKGLISANPTEEALMEETFYGKLISEAPARYSGELLRFHSNALIEMEGNFEFALGLKLLRDYGALAARSGHLGIAESAHDKMKRLIRDNPSRAILPKVLEKYALTLETQMLAVRDGADTAYRRLMSSGGWIISDDRRYVVDSIIRNPELFAPLYEDRRRLAYFLQVNESELGRPQKAGIEPVPYPDLTGKLIEPSTRPPRLEQPGREAVPEKRTPEAIEIKGRVLD